MENKDDFVGVSILCLAYNHEKFIADAIESFLMQKTTFPFEIIIHDDASTDRTAEIIKQYEKRYPDIIKSIFQKENQYSKGVSINVEFFLPITKGKYVALCDGDDYWSDPLKLQKQFEALENNKDCFMCLHRVVDMDMRNVNAGKSYLPKKNLDSGVIESRSFIKILGEGDFFNEVCYFFNAEKYKQYQKEYPLFAKLFMRNKADDAPMLYYFANLGNVYYLKDNMAVYRRYNIGSWSHSMSKKDNKDKVSYFINAIDAFEEFNRYTQNKYSNELNRIIKYNLFNYYYCLGNYKKMLSPDFDIIWNRQSPNFHKRISLLSKNPRFWGKVFEFLDAVRKL